MEYYLFEVLYKGLTFENSRAMKKFGVRKIKWVREHFRFLKVVLQLLNAIDKEVDEMYLQSVRLVLIEMIQKNPKTLGQYDAPVLHTGEFYPKCKRDYKYVLSAINYLFDLIDECLSFEDVHIDYLNLLIASVYPLPSSMLVKGYLDGSYAKNISQDKAIRLALRNMDRTLKNEIIYIVRNTPRGEDDWAEVQT